MPAAIAIARVMPRVMSRAMPRAMPRVTPRGVAAAVALGCAAGSAHAQVQAPTPAASDAVRTLPPITVTATRIETPAFDVPASVDRVDDETIRTQRAQVNIGESLGAVPGLLARDRQNYAQDVQLSVRGFGARASFGIRGVRLYVDGIPATLPDGQGQISHVELGTTDRIEVLRGPFSALYGNSSGGVVQVFTEEGHGPPTLAASVAAGSDSLRRTALRASGASGGFGYVVGASRFTTDGYRAHSEADRRLGNAKLTFSAPDASSKLTLVANSVALPLAQDPLGLTRAQFESDPRGVDASAIAFDTRKTIEQTQAGAIFEHRFDAAHSLRLLGYGGHRGTEQFQAIPVAAQAPAQHPGGVISLARDYQGLDLRWTWRVRGDEDGRRLTLVGGLAYDALVEQRRGYQNFVGTTLGVRGALRRDERNTASNLDPYLQATWRFAPRWSLDAGVRRSRVRFESRDAYVQPGNPDDSGGVRYSATLPALALRYAPDETLRLYVAAGRGFETPTLNELAYRPNGATGLNLALAPARSDHVEIGMKWRGPRPGELKLGELNLAWFDVRTNDEIVVLSSAGGRTTYRNAGATRRRGVELGWSGRWLDALQARFAATWLDAYYADGFATCAAAPCTTPTLAIPAGNRLPGIARTSLYASLGWWPETGWRAGIEARALGRVTVDDANSDAAPGYAVLGASAGYRARAGAWTLEAFVRGDNLAGRRYAGSVIVNEANGRFFEPAPARTWLIGTSASFAF